MSQAIFEARFDPITRLPILPRGENGEGDFTLFDGSPGCGWALCYSIGETPPPTVTVRIKTGAAIMAEIMGTDDPLWLFDSETPEQPGTGPVRDRIKATLDQTPMMLFMGQAAGYVDWLVTAGWDEDLYADVFLAMLAASYRYEIGNNIIEGLHAPAVLEDVENIALYDVV